VTEELVVAPTSIPDVVSGQRAQLHPEHTVTPVPKWEAVGKEQLRATIRHVTKHLQELATKDANEADTRMVVTDLLRDGLGYKEYGDLATEYRVRGEYADYGIRIDKQLIAFVEVKRAATKLGPRHLRQIELYAVNEGVEWLILTNASAWQVYHLSPGMPVVIDLALEVDLLSSDTPARKVDKLFYLHHESLRRRQIDDLWRLQAATSPKALAEALLSADVTAAISKEIRRRTKQRVSATEVIQLLQQKVILPGCLE